MGETSQEDPEESQEGTGDDSVVPGSNDDRGDRKTGIKDLGRQVREGLDELERLRRYELERLRLYDEPKVENKSIKCPCCNEVISGVDHICDTYETLCEKINRGEFNSGKPLTDYQVEVLERRTPMI